jgi:cytochrome bd-type quinol oxidase subunit 2
VGAVLAAIGASYKETAFVMVVFMLAGIGFPILIMLIYNAYQYLVFQDKVTEPGNGAGC